MKESSRCSWAEGDALMQAYHDEEWGKPLHDDRKIFEAIILDTFQAGLSWKTILHKRENFRKAFDGFDPIIIAEYDEEKQAELLQDAGIIRNKLKVKAASTNAKHFLRLQKENGSFARYIWQFTQHKTINNSIKSREDFKVTSPESDLMSKTLKQEGFKFVGSTICYAFMQAIGMVNDHDNSCACK